MLRDKKGLFLLLLAGLLVLTTGCPENSDLAEGDSAPVVLEIQILNTPAVTAQPGGAANDCTTPAFQVQEWDATAVNSPKNSEAITSPFNDIELVDVTIGYSCDAGIICPPVRTIGLTGTVPADANVQFTFFPIFLQDINATMLGTTISLDMLFRAQTVSGQDITYRTGAILGIESCVGGGP